MNIFKLTLIPIIVLLEACATTLKPTPLGADGYFKTDAKIVADGVKLKKKFTPKFKRMIYVQADKNSERFNKFFIESFANMGQFKKVMSKEDMESLVLEKNLQNVVSSVSDKIGLYNLQRKIGSFLVVEPYTDWLGGYIYMARIKAYDPKTGKEVLILEHEAFNWAGLDQPLFYPLFNAFLQWVRGEEIQTAPFSTDAQYKNKYPIQ